ncbi:MAG: iron uptake porin [Cyanobacteria bacterium P01_A01_bin.83]
MKQKVWLNLSLGSVLLSGILLQISHVTAQVVIDQNEIKQPFSNSLKQVTNVNQLRDIAPTDWAYEALRSLVDRYGCISGFGDQTYRGNKPLSRYEFAAGLNSCLNQIERLIASLEVDNLDLASIQRLQDEFDDELTAIEGRVDNLETRAASLEDDQFSTTTKLKGQVIFSVTNAFGDDKAVPSGATAGSAGEVDDETVFDNRVRLNFDSSFTGKDLLKVRLDALNVERFGVGVTGTNMTRLAFDRPLNNDVAIGKLFYRFRATDKLRFVIDGTRGRYNANISDTFNDFFANPFKGSISNFGRFNPIYIQGVGGAGVTAVYQLNDAIAFNAGYLARNPDNPTEENGLFDGSFAALAQLDIAPTKNLKFGLTYVRAYYPAGRAFVTGGTGSRLANAPFGNIDTSADHFGLQTSLSFNPIEISGWAGYTIANAETDGVGIEAGDNSEVLNWAISLAFPDFGGEGNVAGLIVGQQPRIIDSDTDAEEDDSSWHLQAQYRYRINKNVSVNPGLIAILNPENNDDNDTVYVGTFRTIFEF